MRIKQLLLALVIFLPIAQACTERDPFPLDWTPREIDFNRLQTDQGVQIYVTKISEDDITLSNIEIFGNNSRLDPSNNWLRRSAGLRVPVELENNPGEIKPTISFGVFFNVENMPVTADTAEIVIEYDLAGSPGGSIRIPIGLPKPRRERNLTNNPTYRLSYPVKFSPSGDLILYNSNQRRSGQDFVFDGYTMSITGSEIRRITDSKEGENSYVVDMNQNGVLVLYYTDFPDGSREIFYKNVQDDRVFQVTDNGATNTPVAFNSQGNTIVFNSNQSGPFGVYTYTIGNGTSTTGQEEKVSAESVDEYAVGWSPNSDNILIVRKESGVNQIYLSTNKQPPLGLTRNANNNDIPVEIAAGSTLEKILFFSERNSRREVWRMTTAVAELRQLTNNNVYDYPVTFFDQGSKVLFYSTDYIGNTNIFIVDDRPDAVPKQVTAFESSQIPVDIHPNNNTILYYSERRFRTSDIFLIDIEN